MIRWFGPAHSDPPFRVDDIERVPIPTDQSCAHCREPITAEEFGFVIAGVVGGGPEPWVFRDLAWHDECHVRQAVGSVEHQRKPICDGRCIDDPGLTAREAAKAAAAYFRR